MLLFCVTVFLLFTALPPNNLDETIVPVNDPPNQLIVASYIEHNPIVITSNADFESQGWSGNGTEGMERVFLIAEVDIAAVAIVVIICAKKTR
ncbi:MAG: hypothetical protein KGY80_03775 [Candidatus Thorarchaeota archaeon]|nr:hypothetical protein [Candidatus Thorarchaeota archaeon]